MLEVKVGIVKNKIMQENNQDTTCSNIMALLLVLAMGPFVPFIIILLYIFSEDIWMVIENKLK